MIILLYKGDDRPAFRKYHNPGDVKINMTDKLVTTYQGKESQLYRLICKETYFSDETKTNADAEVVVKIKVQEIGGGR